MKEGAENAAKEGVSNPKVIKLLVKTVIDISQKFAKIAAKLPLIGKFFKKGLGKVLVDAAPNVGKELAEKAAKESAEYAAKNAAKNATKGGLRAVSGVTKDAAAATMGISYLVGVVIDVAFFAYDVQDG